MNTDKTFFYACEKDTSQPAAIINRVKQPVFELSNTVLITPTGDCITEMSTNLFLQNLSILSTDCQVAIGFDVNAIMGASFSRHSPLNCEVVDTQSYLRALGYRNDIETAMSLTSTSSPIEAIQTLYEYMMSPTPFNTLERYAARRTLEENLRGIKVDTILVANILQRLKRELQRIIAAIAKDHPEIDTSSLQSALLSSNASKEVDANHLEDLARKVTYYQQVTTAIRMARNIENAGSSIFFPFMYHGAFTGRATAAGIDAGKANLHNLFSHERETTPSAALELKQAIVPSPGKNFVSGDSSNIEPRVLALVCQEEILMDAFLRGVDVYIEFAKKLFPGVTIVKGGENNHLRDLAKEALIALGYGMGYRRFQERIQKRYPHMDEHLIRQVYDGYQNTYRRNAETRQRLFATFRYILDGGAKREINGIRFSRIPNDVANGGGVAVRILSGKFLFYRGARLLRSIEGDHLVTKIKYAPHYYPQCDHQNLEELRATTLINHICQATARDIIVAQQHQIEKQSNLRVIFNVHDELIVECDECRCDHRNDVSLPLVQRHHADCPWMAARATVFTAMSVVPNWMKKLQGLPLACTLNDNVRERWDR